MKILTKHISCTCKCKFDGRKCNSNQKWNNDRCRCEYKYLKENHVFKKDHICNPNTCGCENGKYLASITADSVITFDEIIDPVANSYDEETKTIAKKTIPTKNTSTNFYSLLGFLIIVIPLLIAANIYLIKC